jgi:hypothetical protein
MKGGDMTEQSATFELRLATPGSTGVKGVLCVLEEFGTRLHLRRWSELHVEPDTMPGEKNVLSCDASGSVVWHCNDSGALSIWSATGKTAVTTQPGPRVNSEFVLCARADARSVEIFRRGALVCVVSANDLQSVSRSQYAWGTRCCVSVESKAGKKYKLVRATNWIAVDQLVMTTPDLWSEVDDGAEWTRRLAKDLAGCLNVALAG